LGKVTDWGVQQGGRVIRYAKKIIGKRFREEVTRKKHEYLSSPPWGRNNEKYGQITQENHRDAVGVANSKSKRRK